MYNKTSIDRDAECEGRAIKAHRPSQRYIRRTGGSKTRTARTIGHNDNRAWGALVREAIAAERLGP